MATFVENFRGTFGGQPFTKFDPIAEAKNQKANWGGFEEAIDRGEVRGTQEHTDKEVDTMRKMDNLYRLLANEFQDRFYEKHYNKESHNWDNVAEKQMLKESDDFLKEVVDNRGINDEEFANGRTFLDNFRRYSYPRILLPDIYNGSKNYSAMERRVTNIAPARYTTKSPNEKMS